MYERCEWRSLNNNYFNDITIFRDGIHLSNFDFEMEKKATYFVRNAVII